MTVAVGVTSDARTIPQFSQTSSPGETGCLQFGQKVAPLPLIDGEAAEDAVGAVTPGAAAKRGCRTAPQFSQISSVGATG